MTNCTKEPENDAVKTHNDAIDLVSRQAAIREYQEVCSGISCGECPFLIKVNTEKGSHLITDCKLEAFLHNLPSAQPKTGKWILSDNQSREDMENGNYYYICSNCLHGDVHAKTQEVPYCWHCGSYNGGE